MKNQFIQYMYSYPHKTAYDLVEKLELSPDLRDFNKKEITLYMHLPFCDSKCAYCNLFSVPLGGDHLVDDYVAAIQRQNQQYQDYFKLKEVACSTLVLGGGTPTFLSIDQLERLFQIAERDYAFDLDKGFSIIETSPNQTTEEKLAYLESKKIKRISIGVQSFVQSELNTLGRHHSAVMAEKALKTIRQFDFPILNIDLIYGIPGQTMETLIYSAFRAIKYQPEEIFVYPLYAQTNTRMGKAYTIDEPEQARLYEGLKSYLEANGYHALSMRRFAKARPDKLGSCGFETTLALGCGGRSYIENIHFCEPYTAEPKACLAALKEFIGKEDFLTQLAYYQLDEEEMKRRYVIKNLLNGQGIDLADYRGYFSDNIFESFPQILEFQKKNWLQVSEENIQMTALGFVWSDYMGPSFISDKVKRKMGDYSGKPNETHLF